MALETLAGAQINTGDPYIPKHASVSQSDITGQNAHELILDFPSKIIRFIPTNISFTSKMEDEITGKHWKSIYASTRFCNKSNRPKKTDNVYNSNSKFTNQKRLMKQANSPKKVHLSKKAMAAETASNSSSFNGKLQFNGFHNDNDGSSKSRNTDADYPSDDSNSSDSSSSNDSDSSDDEMERDDNDYNSDNYNPNDRLPNGNNNGGRGGNRNNRRNDDDNRDEDDGNDPLENGDEDYVDSEDENPLSVVLPPANARPVDDIPLASIKRIASIKKILRAPINFHQEDGDIENEFTSEMDDGVGGLVAHHSTFWPMVMGASATEITNNTSNFFMWLHYSADLLRAQSGVSMPPAKSTAEVLLQLVNHHATLGSTSSTANRLSYRRAQFEYEVDNRHNGVTINVRYQGNEEEAAADPATNDRRPALERISEPVDYEPGIRQMPIARLLLDREHVYNRNICYLVAMLVMLYDDDDDADGDNEDNDDYQQEQQEPGQELRRLLKYANKLTSRSRRNAHLRPFNGIYSGRASQGGSSGGTRPTTLLRFLHSTVGMATAMRADTTFDAVRFDSPSALNNGNGSHGVDNLGRRRTNANQMNVWLTIQQASIGGCIALLAIAKALPNEPATEEGRRKYLPLGGELQNYLGVLANDPAAYGIFPENTRLGSFTRAQLEYIQLSIISAATKIEMGAAAIADNEAVELNEEERQIVADAAAVAEHGQIWAIYPAAPTTRYLSYGYWVLGGHDIDLHPYQLLNVVWPPPSLPTQASGSSELSSSFLPASLSSSSHPQSISSIGRGNGRGGRGGQNGSRSSGNGRNARTLELQYYSYAEVLILTPGSIAVGYAQLMSEEKPKWTVGSRGAVMLNVNTGMLTIDCVPQKTLMKPPDDEHALIISVIRCTVAPYKVWFYANGRYVANGKPKIRANVDDDDEDEDEVEARRPQERRRGRPAQGAVAEPEPVPELFLTLAVGCYQQALLLRNQSQWQWSGECQTDLNKRIKNKTIRFREVVVSDQLLAREAQMTARLTGERNGEGSSGRQEQSGDGSGNGSDGQQQQPSEQLVPQNTPPSPPPPPVSSASHRSRSSSSSSIELLYDSGSSIRNNNSAVVVASSSSSIATAATPVNATSSSSLSNTAFSNSSIGLTTAAEVSVGLTSHSTAADRKRIAASSSAATSSRPASANKRARTARVTTQASTRTTRSNPNAAATAVEVVNLDDENSVTLALAGTVPNTLSSSSSQVGTATATETVASVSNVPVNGAKPKSSATETDEAALIVAGIRLSNADNNVRNNNNNGDLSEMDVIQINELGQNGAEMRPPVEQGNLNRFQNSNSGQNEFDNESPNSFQDNLDDMDATELDSYEDNLYFCIPKDDC